MKLLVVGSILLTKDSKGKYYADSVYSYSFFKRYLNVFDEVRIFAKTRVASVDEKIRGIRVDGPGLEVYECPWYRGLRDLARQLTKLIPVFRHATVGCDCVIYRIPQIESFGIWYLNSLGSLPHAVEVVTDPELLGGIPNWMKKVSAMTVKAMCRRAIGASYVTERYLQAKYPSRLQLGDTEAFDSTYSSVELSEDDIAERPKTFTMGKIRIVHMANAIHDDTKGLTTFLRCIAVALTEGVHITAVSIGDGDALDGYRKMACELGISDLVEFKGKLSDRNDVLETLRSCDLMVLPTKMEGLPRTIIEGMAVGLPCISTPIAGIPEIINRKYLFEPDDYEEFGREVIRLAKDPDELSRMSSANIAIARRYTSEVLTEKRTAFYRQLRVAVGQDAKRTYTAK